MTLTTHATIGAVIGKATGNPLLAFVFGILSHYLVDIIPHGDTGLSDNFRIKKKNRKRAVAYTMVDACVCIFFILMIANTKDIASMQTFTWGIAGAILPDFLVGLYELTKSPLLAWQYKIHFYFHDLLVNRKGDVPLYYSVLAQIVLISYLQTKL
jgi:hypothetical protein